MTNSILIICKPHLSLFSTNSWGHSSLNPMRSGDVGLPLPCSFPRVPSGTFASSSVSSRHSIDHCAKREKHFGTTASMTRCVCMRTIKTEPHTYRHGNNYAHNLCMPNHKETNAAKMVKNPIFAKFCHFRSYSALNSVLTIFSGKGPDFVADPFGTVPRRCLNSPRKRKRTMGKIPEKIGEVPKRTKKKDKSRSGNLPVWNPPVSGPWVKEGRTWAIAVRRGFV